MIGDVLAARPWLAMHAMDGLLLGGVPLAAVADALGTPAWVYAAPTIRERHAKLCDALAGAGLDAGIRYAVKANDHLAILSLLGGLGAGADVVSGGELQRARRAGIATEKIVFSGVGKTRDELAMALDVAQINVESAAELDQIAAVASAAGRTARVALRVNPDIDAGTHGKISTGRAGDKFGVAHGDVVALYGRAAALPWVRPVGLAVHIGSQVTAMAAFRAAYERVATLVAGLRASGHAVQTVDCGGGLGIGYADEPDGDPRAWAGAIGASFRGLDVRLLVEPGRWLVGPAGVLLARVLLEKRADGRRIVVLDAAMNDLIRPALYDAVHAIVPVSAADAAAEWSPADIVGPVCESGDRFGSGRKMPKLAPGALVAILDAGAYGAVMSSTYNARPLAAQAMTDRGGWTVIRARQDVSALWAGEIVPDR